MSNRLNRVVSGIQSKPAFVCIYGKEGVGKSTFGADAPSPIFIDAEEGTSRLDAKRLPDINSWSDVTASLDELLNSKHPYKTLVIDSLDKIERWLHASIIATANADTLMEYKGGYGKGPEKALQFWEPFLSKLKALRAQGMHIILICHYEVKDINDPDMISNYSKHQLNVDKKAAALIRATVEDLLYARFETFVTKEKNEKKGRAAGEGRRIMYTEARPTFDAKNRNSLPFQMDVSWKEYFKYFSKGQDPETLKEQILEIASTLPQATIEKIEAEIKKANDNLQALLKIKNRTISTLNKNTGE